MITKEILHLAGNSQSWIPWIDLQFRSEIYAVINTNDQSYSDDSEIVFWRDDVILHPHHKCVSNFLIFGLS